jgi:stage IV sporulation protein FB
MNKWFFLVIAVFFLLHLWYQVGIVFLSILIHEIAHVLVALKRNYCVREIELLPFGGVARIEGLAEAGLLDAILIAGAGPLVSLSIVLILYFYQMEESYYFRFIAEVNVMLVTLNLLPALPLDGGRILQAILTKNMEYKKSLHSMVNISYVIAFLMIGKAIYDYMYDYKINISLFIIATFLVSAARAEVRKISFRTVRIMMRKKEALMRRGMMMTRQYIVLKKTPVRELIQRLETERYGIILVLDDTAQVCTILTEFQLWDKLSQQDYKVSFGDIIERIG